MFYRLTDSEVIMGPCFSQFVAASAVNRFASMIQMSDQELVVYTLEIIEEALFLSSLRLSLLPSGLLTSFSFFEPLFLENV